MESNGLASTRLELNNSTVGRHSTYPPACLISAATFCTRGSFISPSTTLALHAWQNGRLPHCLKSRHATTYLYLTHWSAVSLPMPAPPPGKLHDQLRSLAVQTNTQVLTSYQHDFSRKPVAMGVQLVIENGRHSRRGGRVDHIGAVHVNSTRSPIGDQKCRRDLIMQCLGVERER